MRKGKTIQEDNRKPYLERIFPLLLFLFSFWWRTKGGHFSRTSTWNADKMNEQKTGNANNNKIEKYHGVMVVKRRKFNFPEENYFGAQWKWNQNLEKRVAFLSIQLRDKNRQLYFISNGIGRNKLINESCISFCLKIFLLSCCRPMSKREQCGTGGFYKIWWRMH